MVDGVLIVDKPKGWTSFDVVARLRRLYNTKKVGHSGTLDPMATGVLPIFFGHATKFIGHLPSKDKGYVAEVTFGIMTDTGDITGEITKRCDAVPSEEQLLEAMKGFIGEITQIPPMYSAIKINGTPLYKLARSGRQAEVKPRRITVHSLKLLDFRENVASIEVMCSEGSYVRTLAEDIAKSCDSLATLSELRRIKSGSCELADAVEMEYLLSQPQPQQMLTPIGNLFNTLPKLTLPPYRITRLKNGLTQNVDGIFGMAALYDNEDFIGIIEGNGEIIKAVRMCQY